MNRRDFLKQALGAICYGFGRSLGPATKVVAAAPVVAAAATGAVAAGVYGGAVRAQVFEIIVRHAMTGQPWKKICAGPMRLNAISQEEIETEMRRRHAFVCNPVDPNCPCVKCANARWLAQYPRLRALEQDDC